MAEDGKLSSDPTDEALQDASDRAGSPPLLDFEQLARGGKEVLIDFHSQIYRLRVTRNGKLILNK